MDGPGEPAASPDHACCPPTRERRAMGTVNDTTWLLGLAGLAVVKVTGQVRRGSPWLWCLDHPIDLTPEPERPTLPNEMALGRRSEPFCAPVSNLIGAPPRQPGERSR